MRTTSTYSITYNLYSSFDHSDRFFETTLYSMTFRLKKLDKIQWLGDQICQYGQHDLETILRGDVIL
ncbi:hypothetical protein ACLOJK_034871 [Asimina triloba]